MPRRPGIVHHHHLHSSIEPVNVISTPPLLRRAFGVTAALVALLTLTGCFTFETVINIRQDGSGTVVQEFVMTGPMLEMISMFAAQTGEPKDPCDMEELQTQAADLGEGVALLDAVPIEADDRLGCRATFGFADINTLRINQDPGNQMPSQMAPDQPESDTTAAQYMTFSFDPGHPSTLVVNIPNDLEDDLLPSDEQLAAQQNAPADSAQQAMQLNMMREMLKGGRVLLALDFDGTIVQSDATYQDDGRVTIMEMDFDEFLADEAKLATLMNAQPKSTEEAKELLKTVPGIKVEANRSVEVRFD